VEARTKVARIIKRITRPVIRAATPSSEAPLVAVALASPITSGPLHLENPRVVGIRPTSPAALKTPQASSAAAWWSSVMTVQIGPRQAVDPVTMVASQTAHKSSTGTNAQSAHRSRRGTRTRSRLHGRLLSMKSESRAEFGSGDEDRRRLCNSRPLVTKPEWLGLLGIDWCNTVSYLNSQAW
jgi:hypothetical protein